MSPRVSAILAPAFIFATVFVAAAPVAGYAKAIDMKAIDPDGDGTVSLDEAKTAADQKFAAMDPDKDGTIDKTEAAGMSKAAFKSADPDKDGTIDKAEYTAAVEADFKKADTDGDGTLDKKELSSPAGKKLLGLIQ